ncbi:hypothetical protein KAR91_72140 [Candidatus Pacearchaeota archaeon]|nr:hypothetical protein [Candidatus Pacearchaeota archaeon]
MPEVTKKPLECDCGNDSEFFTVFHGYQKTLECGHCGKELFKFRWMFE